MTTITYSVIRSYMEMNRDQFEKEMSDRLDMEKEKLAAAMAAQDDQGRPPVCGTAYAGKLERQPH